MANRGLVFSAAEERLSPATTRPLPWDGEQYEPRCKEITGNFPQAYFHVGFATMALRHLEARRARGAL